MNSILFYYIEEHTYYGINSISNVIELEQECLLRFKTVECGSDDVYKREINFMIKYSNQLIELLNNAPDKSKPFREYINSLIIVSNEIINNHPINSHPIISKLSIKESYEVLDQLRYKYFSEAYTVADDYYHGIIKEYLFESLMLKKTKLFMETRHIEIAIKDSINQEITVKEYFNILEKEKGC